MDDEERTRALLRTYGERSAPTASETDRAWAALATATAAPGATAARSGALLKTVLGSVAVITIGAAVWGWTRTSDEVAPAPIVAATPVVAAAPEEETPVAPTMPSAPDTLAPATHRAAPARVVTAAPRSPAVGTLAEELALMDAARQAIARDDAAAALVALDEHAQRFPTGTLVREGEVLRVTALCASGRDDEAIAAATSAGPRPAITRALSRCGPR